MNVLRLSVPAVALGLVLAACNGGEKVEGSSTDQRVIVTLAELNESGERGTASLFNRGDETEVVIVLQGAPATAQPAHIHEGTCAKLDPKPRYPLADVVNGTSNSTVKVALPDLRKGTFAINVHRSAKDLETYVACGEIAIAS